MFRVWIALALVVLALWMARWKRLPFIFFLWALFPPIGVLLALAASPRCDRCRNPISVREFRQRDCPRCASARVVDA